MSSQTVRDILQNEICSLPESLAGEVLDFVLFMKARHVEESFLWQQVEETRALRRQHPDDVQTVTPDEWDGLAAQLDDES